MKATGSLLKIGTLVGAVVLADLMHRRLGLAGLADDIFDPSSTDFSSDVPTDILVPFNSGYDPSYGYQQPQAYQPSYPYFYQQQQAYGYQYQQPYYAQPQYGGYPSQPYPYQGSNYPTPNMTYPAINPDPLTSIVSSLVPTVAITPPSGQEAANEAAVKYGVSAGLLKAGACVGSGPGLSQYHNCTFTVQTSRGAKTVNFKTAAAMIKKYQRTGKL